MLAGLSLLVLSLVQQSVNAGGLISNKYDSEFKSASMFLPLGTDWRLLKAQCYQESLLNPLAVSPVGAIGLCQFMPGTARDMTRKHPELIDFWLPEVSIIAAGRYMGDMNRFWSSERSFIYRYMLALASYNAGAGNIFKAQKLSGMKPDYPSIIAELPNVTGRHSIETTTYVKKIIGEHYVKLIFN